jgi:hypothetical protein
MTTPPFWGRTMTGLTPAGALPLQAARSVAKLLFREFGSLEVIEFLTPDFWILPQKSNFATEPAGATQPSWCSPLEH